MRRTKARGARRAHAHTAAPAAAPSSHRPASKHEPAPVLRSRSRGEQPTPSHISPGASASLSRRHTLRASGSARKRPPHRAPDDDPFLHSPSAIWNRLPLKHRMISLLLGFLSLYYVVFAKHHHYDKEIVAIHSDVEDLMQQAKASGLGENLVEAELPEIFKDTPPPPVPSPAKQVKEKLSATSKPSEGGSKSDALPLKLKKRKKKKKTKKLSTKQKKVKVASGTNLPNSTSTATNMTGKGALEPSSVVANSTNGTVSPGQGQAEEPGKKQETSIQSQQPNTPTVEEVSPNQASVVPTNATQTNNSSAQYISAQALTAQPASSSVSPPTHQTAALGQPTAPSNTTTIAPNASNAEPRSLSKPEEEYDYSMEFKDMEAADVPKEHVPILDWNYEAVIDPETTEQIFGLGNKLDHVAVYKPLCIDGTSGEAISFSGKRVCSGFNRTAGWMMQYCSVMKESSAREYLLNVESERSKEWLKEKESAIRWVEGLTILQVLEKNCGNIAHFSGRALMLQHVIDNVAAYVAPPSRIENILVLPTFHIMKRFLYPHNYGFWHKSVFNALTTPAKFTIGTLGNFLYREQKVPYSGTPRVQLLHNFSLSGGIDEGKQYVCFRRAIVPGYLKARFFVDDIEYPSKKPSLQSSAKDAPTIPRDSLRFRERVSSVFHQSSNFPAMKKEIVLLDRTGSRRVFENETKPKVLESFQKIASEKGYAFKIVSFDNVTFKQQYAMMESASIAIGIHGANLVNTMFMPPLSVLIELFPFGFLHEMYVNGGNAGLKYYRYQMVSGFPFNGPRHYRSVQQCIELNHQCKVHYRDSALKVTDADLTALEQILRQAISWCDERPKPFASAEDAQRTGSQERRRRRLLHYGMYRRRKQRQQAVRAAFSWP